MRVFLVEVIQPEMIDITMTYAVAQQHGRPLETSMKIRRVLTLARVVLITTACAINQWTLCPSGYFINNRLGSAAFDGVYLLGGAALIVFRKNTLTMNVFLGAASAIFCFFFVEIMVRSFMPQVGGRFEHDLLFSYHDILGWALIPGKRGSVIPKHEYNTPIVINTSGFRHRERLVLKGEGKKIIVVLGDSFVAGLGVKNDKLFNIIMEDELINIEVLNFGVNVHTPPREYLLQRESVLAYKPDLVLMVFYTDYDFEDMVGRSEWIDGYKRPRPTIRHFGQIVFTKTLKSRLDVSPPFCHLPRLHLIDLKDRLLHERKEKSALDVLHPEVRICRKNLPPFMAVSIPNLKGIFRDTDTLWRRQQARLAIVIAPTITQVYDNLYWKRIKARYKLNDEEYNLYLPNKIMQNGDEVGLPVLDLTLSLRHLAAQGEGLYYYRNRHWNPRPGTSLGSPGNRHMDT